MSQEIETEVKEENKMGTMPVGKLIFNMSLPMMVQWLCSSIVPILWIVYLLPNCQKMRLTAVSLAFPLQTLLIAVGAGTGVGMNALFSKSLGEKNFKKANDTAANCSSIIYFKLYFILDFRI